MLYDHDGVDAGAGIVRFASDLSSFVERPGASLLCAGNRALPSLSYLYGKVRPSRRASANRSSGKEPTPMALDDKTRTELEAAAFRRLIEHLRARTDVQNIDLMNLAGFCRNCLSNWMKDAADARGVPMSKDESREVIYGMPYEQWKAEHQKEASKDQQAAFEKAAQHKH
jgi:uncharacterized protein